tara:strand:- start:3090 stop:3449 length:360 start_codon:yes stop_codon:yes gene_type:complete
MAYNTEELYNLAVKYIETDELYFIEDVVALLGINKATFYDHFKVDSDELNYFKELLRKNKSSAKVAMRKKWKDSENASLQMGLYKLIGSDEERKRLNQSYIDQKTEHKGKLEIVRTIKK